MSDADRQAPEEAAEPDPQGREAAAQQELRLRRREILLAELAEARALRRRLHPRKVRLARERAVLHAATLRR